MVRELEANGYPSIIEHDLHMEATQHVKAVPNVVACPKIWTGGSRMPTWYMLIVTVKQGL